MWLIILLIRFLFLAEPSVNAVYNEEKWTVVWCWSCLDCYSSAFVIVLIFSKSLFIKWGFFVDDVDSVMLRNSSSEHGGYSAVVVALSEPFFLLCITFADNCVGSFGYLSMYYCASENSFCVCGICVLYIFWLYVCSNIVVYLFVSIA